MNDKFILKFLTTCLCKIVEINVTQIKWFVKLITILHDI